MIRSCLTLARLAAATVSLATVLCASTLAGDHLHREPTFSKGHCRGCRYTRETNHGLIHYPCATYWASGDAANSVDRWDTTDRPTYSSYEITPSPWAFSSIAPYTHQFHSSSIGTGWGDCGDCRN